MITKPKIRVHTENMHVHLQMLCPNGLLLTVNKGSKKIRVVSKQGLQFDVLFSFLEVE